MSEAVGAPTVSLVLPAWNEAEGLAEAVGEAIVALDHLVAEGEVASYEIVVVDDGSTDATAAVAARLAGEHPQVHPVVHGRNRGVGAGLRSGLGVATGTVLVSTDSDMPVDLAEIRPALARLDAGADLVAGCRRDRRSDGWLRWMTTEGYDLAIRLAFGVRVDDVNFAFKVVRTDVLRRLDLCSEGPFIDAEVMILAQFGGFAVEVMPMTYRPRRFGTSSTLSVRTLSRLLRELVLALPRLHRLRRASRRARAGGQRNG